MTETGTVVEGLEKRIRRLEDIEAIRQLTARAAWATDTLDRVASWELWADDEGIALDLSQLGGKLERFEGRDAVREFVLTFPNPWLTWHPAYELHLNSNHLIEVEGDRARCRYAALGYLRNEEGKAFLNGIRYDFELVRTPDGWRVMTRTQSWIVPPEDRMKDCPPPQPRLSDTG